MKRASDLTKRTLGCVILPLLASFMLASASFAAQSNAASETDRCELMPVGIERALCFDRERPELNSAAQMKLEDEKLAKRLQGICRGC